MVCHSRSANISPRRTISQVLANWHSSHLEAYGNARALWPTPRSNIFHLWCIPAILSCCLMKSIPRSDMVFSCAGQGVANSSQRCFSRLLGVFMKEDLCVLDSNNLGVIVLFGFYVCTCSYAENVQYLEDIGCNLLSFEYRHACIHLHVNEQGL